MKAGAGRGRRVAIAVVMAVVLAGGGLTFGVAKAFADPSPGRGGGQDDGHGHGNEQGNDQGKGHDKGSKGKPTGHPSATPGATHPADSDDGSVLGSSSDAVPTGSGIRGALTAALQDKSLGTVTIAVLDAASGQLLYGSHENDAATPASTTKLLTSTAALQLLPAETRLATTVVKGAAPGEIILVGGGDPTLTALPADQIRIDGAPVDADTAPASLTDLAKQTATALKAQGLSSVKLGYDTSLYTGPQQHQNRDQQNIALVTPLMVDEGRVDPKSAEEAPARVADPTAQAVDAFTLALKAQGITVDGKAGATTAAQGAAVLGKVESPTIARLIERALTMSDNQLAEALARQVAIAAHQSASFEGAATAVTQTLGSLGVPLDGVVLHDGSGLNTGDQIPPITLAKLLAVDASPDHARLRPVLTGMPVGGFTGTLTKRYGQGSGAESVAGLVHAKTGSLSGVNTLAGTVVDSDGRVLVFALMTRTSAAVDTARAAMDRVVARIATCGCH